MSEIIIHEFKPLFLTVKNIGPFQAEEPFRLDFTDSDDKPCNFFLLMSENGRGKTTLLDLMVSITPMLDMPFIRFDEQSIFLHEDIVMGLGQAQWDFYVKFQIGKKIEKIIFSFCASHDFNAVFHEWEKTELSKYNVNKSEYIWLASQYFEVRDYPEYTSRKEIPIWLAMLDEYRGKTPEKLGSPDNTLPTLIYFPVNRDIPKVISGERSVKQPPTWRYQPVHIFGQESDIWENSLDNLLTWLKWLDDGSFELALENINKHIFAGSGKLLKGVRKATMEAEIASQGKTHRLDRLSSGEKSLLQLYLRTITHMTRNTILLIDELDLHLHPKWQHKLLNLLKKMAKDHPGLTIIASSHARELIPAFAHDVPEEGLRKGGHIIEEGLM